MAEEAPPGRGQASGAQPSGEGEEWFVLDSAMATQGPYSWAQLHDMSAAGAVSSATAVWLQGWPDWTPWGQLVASAAGRHAQGGTVDAPTAEGGASSGAGGQQQEPAAGRGPKRNGSAGPDEYGAEGDAEMRKFQEEVRRAEAEAEALTRRKRKRRKGGRGQDEGGAEEAEAEPGEEGDDADEAEDEGLDALEGQGPAGPTATGAVSSALGERGSAEAQEEEGPAEGDEFEDDDGTVYSWNSTLRVWVPKGEKLPQEQSKEELQEDGAGGSMPEYDASAMTFEVEDEDIPSLAQAIAASVPPAGTEAPAKALGKQEEQRREAHWGDLDGGKGAKAGAADEKGVKGPSAKHEAQGEKKFQKGAKDPEREGWFDLKVNTSVYVTGLPLDTNAEELVEVFSKCGVIKEDLESGKPRVKLYRDKESGQFKGDGLITFLKEPSVELAIRIMDGSPLRLGDAQPMSVSAATFQQKGTVFVKKKKAANDKQKRLMKKLEQKALGWGGFDDSKATLPMTVALKHMFTRDELVADPSLAEELEADVMEECSKLGSVEKVKVYDNHPEGVVCVRFKDRDHARKCIEVMNGRWFGGHQVVAFEDTGLVKWGQVRDEEEEVRRLEKFASELEEH